jgi:hypothetical protein
MAAAGPAIFDAAALTVSTTPPLPDPFWLALLLDWLAPLRLDALRLGVGLRDEVGLRAAGFRALALLERDAPDERPLDAVLERVAPPAAGVARVREDALVVLLLDRAAPPDGRLLCPPPELGLVAILSSPSRTCVV